MTIVQGQTTQFKINVLSGLENFAVGTPYTYKIALYTAAASLDNTTTTIPPAMKCQEPAIRPEVRF